MNMGIIIAILSGAAMSIQGVWNTQVTKQTSLWTTNILVQLLALLASIVIWIFADRDSLTKLWQVEPKYMLTAGLLGAFITFSVIRSMDLLGPAKAVLLIVIAQLLLAYIIELLGLFGVDKSPFSVRKLVGIIMAIVGFIIFKWTS